MALEVSVVRLFGNEAIGLVMNATDGNARYATYPFITIERYSQARS